jgi:hypothetical protein
MMSVILLLLALQIKHLILDWLWQPPFEYKNKGKYGHLGGISHASKSGLGTVLCFYIVIGRLTFVTNIHLIEFFIAVGLIEGLIHYHIDYCKIQINNRFGWTPTTSDNFWRLTGVDQFLHQLTYILLVVFSILPLLLFPH